MVELASILVLGIFAQWLAWKIKQPAILPLIIIGLAIGPLSTLLTNDGSKLIDGDAIFTGDLLFSFVQLSVGVILFEGGLTLNLKEVRTHVGTVRNLLVFGMIITFFGGGFAAHFLMDMSYRMSFLFGGLILVSGPTVVMPILRNVKPNAKINTILKWEGILIDPLGALVAVLVYEFINNSQPGEEYTLGALKEFVITISSGIVLGGLSSMLLWYLLSSNKIPAYLRNAFTLALVVMTFALAELVHPEAGLMAATFMGIVMANTKLDEIKKILSFKEDISVILISVLFILLSSRIQIHDIESLGWNSLILFAVVAFVIRPLVIFSSTIKSNLNIREKLFMSWIGPKGIVAAAVASLFSLELTHQAQQSDQFRQEAELLLPLTFLIIVGTVVLQGSTAKLMAQWLGVVRKEPQGILFVGASDLVRRIALKVKNMGHYVLVADTAKAHIDEARRMGLNAYEGNVLSDNIFEEIELANIGKLLAMTSNSAINALSTNWFAKELGDDNVYRLVSKEETENKNLPLANNVLFNSRIDFIGLSQLARDNVEVSETRFENSQQIDDYFAKIHKLCVPLFVLRQGKLNVISSTNPLSLEKGDRLLFLKRNNFNDAFPSKI